MSLNPLQEDLSYLQSRMVYVLGIALFFFIMILTRLYYLQVVKGTEFRSFADQNTLKEIRIPAVRGVIQSAEGYELASNRPAFDIAIIRQYVRDPESLRDALVSLARLDAEDIMSSWKETRQLPPFYPHVVSRDVGYNAMARIQVHQAVDYGENHQFDLQGVEILPHPLRRYPYGSMAAASLGYVRAISREEFTQRQKTTPGWYHLGDHVGASGLERKWEVLLRGDDGFQQKVVNAFGREIGGETLERRLVSVAARSGNDLVTSIRMPLQRYAEERFGEETGALVALDPRTGEVYAIVSQPSFDITQLTGRMSRDEWNRLTKDPGKVFLNRAIQSAYPPASTYKVVVALAALETGVMKPEQRVYCGGGHKVGKRRFRCWKSSGHGSVDLKRALIESCDVYFYVVGQKLGVDRIAHFAHLLGLGKRSGIELSGEAKGLIPTSEWKLRARGSEWHPGETLSIAIGQGYDLVTPLQNAVMLSAVVNGGYLVQPHLTKGFVDSLGNTFPPPNHLLQKQRQSLDVKHKHLQLIKEALVGVVADSRGTARRLRALPMKSGGKTGTAQVVGREARAFGKKHKDHAWYISFAPVEKPEIVVSVIVEHGGSGSAAAAPIAGDVMKKYMELKGTIAASLGYQ